MEPEAKSIFGFREDLDVTDYKVLISPRFVAHAMQFVTMIDKALNMLGPSDEMLSEVLQDIGAKHARYGVKPEYFPTMGKALVSVVGANLGDDVFTMEIQESWIEVYNALSHDMIKGHSEVYTVKTNDVSRQVEPQHQVDSMVWA
jgi:methyl-accepting chemotaxis protein